MCSLINFYFKTFFKSIRNLIPIALLSFIIIGYCIFFNINRSDLNKDYSSAPINRFSIDSNEELLNDIDLSYSEQNWKTFYEKTIKYYELILDRKSSTEDENKIKKEIERFSFLLKENIPFIEEWGDNNALIFLKYLFIEPIVLLILLIVIIFSAQTFSSEMENKTYKLLYTQPISKNKILFSKLLSTILVNLTIIFFLIFLCFIFQCLSKGLGSTKFLVKAMLSKELIYIPIIKYIFYEVVILATLIIITCCIGTFISLLINNSAAAICVSTVFYGLLYILFKNNPTSLIQKYNPCAYVDIDRILSSSPISSLDTIIPLYDPATGHASQSLKPLTNLNILSGTMILIIGVLLIILINILLVNKKRMDN